MCFLLWFKDLVQQNPQKTLKGPKTPSLTLLQHLHWLPMAMDKRIRFNFKILFLTFKALHSSAPSYLSSLLQPYTPARSLRSQQQHLLLVPKTRTQYYGDRSFVNTAATLWNQLPIALRTAPTVTSFKNHLKTFLFEQ